jgi:hypothetical protein
MAQIDLASMPHEAWVRFVYDHEVPNPQKVADPWYFDNDLSFEISDAAKLVNHLTRLFKDFPTTIKDYSLPQIDQGIWFLLCGPIPRCSDCLMDSSVPLAERVECIRSMYNVFADFVAKSDTEVMENCFDMWWDLLADTFWSSAQFRRFSPEQILSMLKSVNVLGIRASPERAHPDQLDTDLREIQSVMLETLIKILKLDDARCQQYALHGLGHLGHPRVAAIVQEYIDTHSAELAPEGIEWLNQCRDGTVM